ncbi:MAG: lipid II flippase MurJ, partial [Ktedonobacterales bacterium]
MQPFTTPDGDEAPKQAMEQPTQPRIRAQRPEGQPQPTGAPHEAGHETGHEMGEALLLSDPSLASVRAQIVPVEEPGDEQQSARTAGGDGGQNRRIVSAAALIMLGQLLSSVLGMVRIVAINILFYGAASGAFIIALLPIQQLSDLLVGGSVSGALIPTFVDYSSPEKRHELRRIYSTVAMLAVLLMALAVAALFILAPWLAPLYLPHDSLADQQLTAKFIRITAFGLFGLGLYAVGSALLYALKDVVYPAFATFIQHVGVIAIGVIALFIAGAQLGLPIGLIFGRQASGSALDALQTTGAIGLAIGFVLGAAGEAALILPGLRRARVLGRPTLH